MRGLRRPKAAAPTETAPLVSGMHQLSAAEHDLKPEVLHPAQVADQARDGHQREPGSGAPAGVGLGEVLALGVDGGPDLVQEGGQHRYKPGQ
jgi:hypothetical protein